MARIGKQDAARCAGLINGRRWAAMATVSESGPLASMVSFAATADMRGVLMHLSTLAEHTRNLMADNRVSLIIGEPDGGQGDPQELARVTLSGHVSAVRPEQAAYGDKKARYLEQLPDAEMRFSFSDFDLFELSIDEVNYVGGFARAYTMDRAAYLEHVVKRIREHGRIPG